MNKIEDVIDTSWAAIDSTEGVIVKSILAEYGDSDGLDVWEPKQTLNKRGSGGDLKEISRRIKK